MPEWQDEDVTRLIQRAQHGDVEAFGQLYECYAPQVFRFLYSHLDDRLDAEDLTGEVFVRVWKSLPSYQPQGIPFGGFLFRVARNALIDHYRRARRRPVDLALEEECLDSPVSDDGSVSDPAHAFSTRQDHKQIQQALEQLRLEYRVVLDLRFLAGLSPEEIARVMGKSPGAIRILQHRALAALRKLIA